LLLTSTAEANESTTVPLDCKQAAYFDIGMNCRMTSYGQPSLRMIC